ncbi:hypothetical protein [Sphingobacterium faecale]|uniref:DUF3300 domain-containing protein n=1 Tax=Sphingobacterium faecale TaxID=2803775 RepID=A0ABS1QZ59_9SPHI|nr:hypothetical protein [Sphingobacterium faecale]MBL1407304.1 hypothetical protein [Sphingobacterium faecale]
MKRYFYLSLLFIGIGFAQPSQAQVSVNINIGSQPLWGPVGYDYVRYYYMPEIDVYYDVSRRKYTYYQGNRWVTKSKLPGRYKHFDIYRTYKVVLNDPSPWRYHRNHRDRYGRYANNHTQIILRDADRKGKGGKYDNRSSKKPHKHTKSNNRKNWDD